MSVSEHQSHLEATTPLFRFAHLVEIEESATGHYDFKIRVWDIDSGACQATLTGHQNVVDSLAVHTDGQTLVSVALDRTLRVWKVQGGTESCCLRQLDVDMDLQSVALSEGKIFGGLSSVVKRGVVQTPAVNVWDLQTLEKEGILWIHDMPFGCSVNVDKVIVDRREVWAHTENTILVWGWADGKASKVVDSTQLPPAFTLHRSAFFCYFIAR